MRLLTSKSIKGGLGAEYGLLGGLIAIAIITTITLSGSQTEKLFYTAANYIDDINKNAPLDPNNNAPTWASGTVGGLFWKSYPIITPITLPAASDPENDPLTYRLVSNDAHGLSFSPEDRTLSGTPTKYGALDLNFEVSDGKETTSATFSLFIQSEPTMCSSIVGTAWDNGTGNYLILGTQAAGSTPILVTCEMDLRGGGWTKISENQMSSPATNFLHNVNDLNLSYSKVILKGTSGDYMDYLMPTDSSGWKSDGFHTQRLSLLLNNTAYAFNYPGLGSSSGSADWPGCHNGASYQPLPVSSLQILEPTSASNCQHAGSKASNYCGYSLEISLPSNTRLTGITDIESYDNLCTSDNGILLNYTVYVK